MSYTQTPRVSILDVAVLPGTPLIFTDFATATPAILAVHPDDGASATVSITCSTLARIEAETARWCLAAMGVDGVVSASEMTDIPSPITGIRVEASDGIVAVEVVQ